MISIKIVSAGLGVRASTLTALPGNFLFLGSKLSDSWIVEHQPVFEDELAATLKRDETSEPAFKKAKLNDGEENETTDLDGEPVERTQEVDDIEQSIVTETEKMPSGYGDEDEETDAYDHDGFFFGSMSSSLASSSKEDDFISKILDVGSTESSNIENCSKYRLKIRDTIHSIGLIKDFNLTTLPDASGSKLFPSKKSQMAGICGHGKSSSLCLVQKGVQPTFETVSQMAECLGFWTAFHVPRQTPLSKPDSSPPETNADSEPKGDDEDDGLAQLIGVKRTFSEFENAAEESAQATQEKEQDQQNEQQEVAEEIPETHTYLIMSRTDRTLLLQANNLQEISNHPHVQLHTDRPTLNLANLSKFSQIVQITKRSILLLSDREFFSSSSSFSSQGPFSSFSF